MAPRRVLLLGANGFLSRHLRTALAAAGIDCLAVSSREADLTDPASVPRLKTLLRPDDSVVMMSTLTPDKGRDYRILMKNVRMAETVCELLASCRCGHFVYLSSDAVYDAHQIPLDEDSSREPVDLYALMHTAREMMIGSVLEKTGVPLCILRPSNIYGPGDTHNNYGPNRFVRTAVREGRIVLFGKGEERRSHLFVRDATDLIIRVLQHHSAGSLNLAAKPAVSFKDVADLIIKRWHQPVLIEHAPRTVPPIHRPYKPTQIFRFIYNLGRPIGPIVHRPYAVSAIFKAFPDFKFTPMEEGLAAYLQATQLEVAPGVAPLPGPNQEAAHPHDHT